MMKDIQSNQKLIYNFMILLIVTLLLILAAVYFYREFISKPKSVIKFYKEVFENHGFKVYVYPFQPLQGSQINTALKIQAKSKDALSFTKEVVSQFDISITNIAHKVQINLVSPQLMQAFFECDQQRYYDKEKFYIEGVKRTVGNSLTFAVGEEWKHKRRIITKMLNFTYIKDLVPKITNIAERRTVQLLQSSQQKNIKDGYQEFDLLELTSDITSSTMIELFFGGGQQINQVRINDMKVDMFVKKMLQLLLKQLFNPLTLLLGNKYTKLGVTQVDRDLNRFVHLFENFVKNYVQKRLDFLIEQYSNKKEIPDTFSDLIQAFYVEDIIKNKQQINDTFLHHLCDVFGGLYVAGTDTTSLNSLMAIYYLIKNPSVLEKLKQQLQQNIPDINVLNYELIKKCTYLEAVIIQSLRMYSSANGIFPRVALEDHFLKVNSNCSIPITKGTIINTQTIPVHYKQQIYKNPNDFKPQRFINEKGEIMTPPPYSWMNFSAGSRACVGKQLALTEMKTIIITLLKNYSFKCEDQGKLLYYKSFSYGLHNVKFYIKKNDSK